MQKLNRRLFGKTDIALNTVTLGTMRFASDKFNSKKDSLDLLNYLYDNGVDTYHTSHEYNTHDYFCSVFRQLKQEKPALNTSHIVKLSSPHFEDIDFSHASLENKVDAQLKALSIDRIDIVQWLFRQKNNTDEIRIPKFTDSVQVIEESFKKLIKVGKVRAFASFPYSLCFADAVNQHHLVDGFVDYLNIGERSWSNKIQHSTMEKQGFIAIRPLWAGQVFDFVRKNVNKFPQQVQSQIEQDGIAHWALSYPLFNPNVSSVIVSISNREQADIAAKIVERVSPLGNIAHFIETTAMLDQITTRD